jgi:macrolide transport system ATP-binding/permease protein
MVRPGAPGIRPSSDVSTLTAEDAEAVAKLPNIRAVVPERSGKYTVRRGQTDSSVSVMGTNWNQPIVNNWPVVEGSGMSEQDYKRMAPVALIGQTVKKNFFPTKTHCKTILVKNIPFEIIGVMGVKGSSMFGTDQDDVVFVPLSTGTVRLFGRAYLSNIVAQAEDVKAIEETQENIRQLLLSGTERKIFPCATWRALLPWRRRRKTR